MRSIHRSSALVLALILSLALAAAPCFAQPQETLAVKKVEPPNWWANMPTSPMLLISGSGLADAKVTANYPGVAIERVEPQPSGHYLFVWLKVSPQAKPGTVMLTVKGTKGTSTVDFPLLARTGKKPAGVSQDDVIYLIMPDRFDDGDASNDNAADAPGQTDRADAHKWHGGDLKGIQERLPYLKDLGVTTLWLTPWTKQDTTTADYHGYHVVDFYAVEPHLGSVPALQSMVAEAHKLGMKVVIDYVVNHTGPLHPWADEPPQSDWFHGTRANHLAAEYEFPPIIDPHSTPRQSRAVLEGWFADRLPDLNPDNPNVRAYLRDNATWWIETANLDGLRLDTFPYSSRKFWTAWHSELRQNFPGLWSVGEVLVGDPWITSYFAGGRAQNDGIDTGVSTVFDIPMTYAIRDVTLHEGDARKIATVLQHDSLYPRPDGLVTLISNHDMRRYMGEEGATVQKLNAAVSLLTTLRGIPQLYSGDEIAMPGGDDPDNRRDFPGGFPGDQRNAFTSTGRTADEQSVFTHTQAMLRLRREHSALRSGTLHHIAVNEKYYAFVRERADDRLLIVFNSAAQPQQLSLDLRDTPLANATALEPIQDAAQAQIVDSHANLTINGMSVAVYRVK
jgi:glycosidase